MHAVANQTRFEPICQNFFSGFIAYLVDKECLKTFFFDYEIFWGLSGEKLGPNFCTISYAFRE